MELRFLLKNKTVIYAQIFFVLVMLWLRDVLHFPSAISYITDVLLLFLLFASFYKKSKLNILKILSPQYIIVGLILLCMLFGAIINLVDPLLVVWGLRNNLRFFLFFFICVNLLDETDVQLLLKSLKVFFWINAAMCTIQYFAFDLKADYLGGFFGTERGCNSYLNIFICMICAIAIADFYTGKLKARYLALYIACALYLTIIAELKVFYIEILLIIFVTVLSLKPSLKTVAFCVLSISTLIVAMWILYRYDINSFLLFFDTDAMEVYLLGQGYTQSGDLNRFTAIEQIHSKFFDENMRLSLFGFGLGNCEYSQYSFLQSEFSKSYGYLNYRWFTHAWVYLEQGFVGIVLLLAFFVSLFVFSVKQIIKNENKYYMIISLAFLPICVLGLLYNTAIQIEVCYLIAFMCAIPYIVSKTSEVSVNED